MNPARRQWLVLGGAGAAAAALGVGVWRSRSTEPALPDAAAASPLWQARFDQPDGTALEMASMRGQVLVLNFWATWCPPCVKEMPELDRFAQAHAARGVRVVGLALDSPTPVREFLRRTPVRYTIALAGFEGSELARQLGNDKGALPFTALFDRNGRQVQHKLGETSYDELSRWVASL